MNTIFTKYGSNCKIVCCYNAMNDTYASQILAVCNELGGVDAGIYTIKLEQAEIGQHPSIEDHLKYAEVLTALIKSMIGDQGK